MSRCILPARKDRPVTCATVTTVEEAKQALGAILDAVASGALTPSEAGEVAKLIEGYVKSIEVTEVLARLEKLEGAHR